MQTSLRTCTWGNVAQVPNQAIACSARAHIARHIYIHMHACIYHACCGAATPTPTCCAAGGRVESHGRRAACMMTSQSTHPPHTHPILHPPPNGSKTMSPSSASSEPNVCCANCVLTTSRRTGRLGESELFLSQLPEKVKTLCSKTTLKNLNGPPHP